MSKIGYIIVIAFSVVLFLTTTTVLAGPYDFEGTDSTDDVQDLVDNGNFTSEYPDLDITFAKVEEKGDNLIFTLQVKRNIVPDNSSIRYNFLIESVNTSDSIEVLFMSSYKAYVYREEPFFKVDCSDTYTISDDAATVNVTAPKTAFENISLPWNVTAKARVYTTRDEYLDELILEPYVPQDTNGDTTGGGDDSEKGIPGFETIAVVVASLIAVILWRKHRRSR